MPRACEPFGTIAKYIEPASPLFAMLAVHSVLVTQKARWLALSYLDRHPDAELDLDFLTEAAMLHDIGIIGTHAPDIHCTGTEPYICHGVVGRGILENEGLPRHALVCERHTGSGITRAEVVEKKLPLPERDYLPVTLEEKIICVADKFYGKKLKNLWRERPLAEIRRALEKFGPAVAERWRVLEEEVVGSP